MRSGGKISWSCCVILCGSLPATGEGLQRGACMSKCQQLGELGSMNGNWIHEWNWKDRMLESPNFSWKSHEWISILPYQGQELDKATGAVCIHMSAKSV